MMKSTITIVAVLLLAALSKAEFCRTSGGRGQCLPDFVCNRLGFPSEESDCPDGGGVNLVCCEGVDGVPCFGNGDFGFCTAQTQCPGNNFLPGVACGGAPFPAVVCCKRDIECVVIRNGLRLTGSCVPGKFCDGENNGSAACPGTPGSVCCIKEQKPTPCPCRCVAKRRAIKQCNKPKFSACSVQSCGSFRAQCCH